MIVNMTVPAGMSYNKGDLVFFAPDALSVKAYGKVTPALGIEAYNPTELFRESAEGDRNAYLIPEMKRAIEFCERWGVEVVNAVPALSYQLGFKNSTLEKADYFPGPTNSEGAIDWRSRTILWPMASQEHHHPYNSNTRYGAASLIHELAHVLDDVRPSEANEQFGHYLAFEAAAARIVKHRQLRRWQETLNYDFPHEGPLGYEKPSSNWYQMSRANRADIRRCSFAAAVKLGLMTPEGEFTYRKVRP